MQVVEAVSGFLTGNPITSTVIDVLGADAGVKALIAAMKSVAEAIAPVEIDILVRREHHSASVCLELCA